jgi:hypothetical protein
MRVEDCYWHRENAGWQRWWWWWWWAEEEGKGEDRRGVLLARRGRARTTYVSMASMNCLL